MQPSDPRQPVRRRVARDIVAALALVVVTFLLAGLLDLYERMHLRLRSLEWMQADELVFAAVALIFAVAWFASRRWQEAEEELRRRLELEVSLGQSAACARLQAEVGLFLTVSRPRPETLQVCAEAVVEHLDAAFARIWILDDATQTLELKASAGCYTHLDGAHSRVPVGKLEIGLIARERKPHLTNHVVGDPRIRDQEWAKREGMVAFAGYPLEAEGRVEGVLALFARHPLADSMIESLGGVCRTLGLSIARHRSDEALELSEQSQQEAHASLRLATERAKVAVWTADLRTLTVRFTSGWKHLLGYDDGELTVAAVRELVHPDDRANASKSIEEHIQGRADVYEAEQRMLHADGSYRWVISRGSAIYDANGRPTHLVGADMDITATRGLEERLAHSEERYRHLVEEIAEVIYVADRDGRVTYMSPVAERLFGYSPAEVLSQHFSDFIFPEDLAGVAAGFLDALSGQPQPHDHRVVTKTGEVRWVRNDTRPILENGEIVGLRGVLAETTAQKEAEEALRELSASLEVQVNERTRELVATHEQLQMITDNMSDMVSRVSLDGVYEYVSPAHEWALGIPPQQMVGKSIYEFLHPDDLARVTATVETTIATASGGSAEFRYRHADGHYVWLETRGRLLFDDSGVAVGAVLAGRETTQRRQAEESLRESEVRFASAFSNAPIGMALVAPEGRILKVNHALCEIIGYRAEELVRGTFRDFTPPDAIEADLGYLRRVLAGETGPREMERYYVHKLGHTVWVLLSLTLVRDSQRQPLYFIAQLQDITERKKARASLQTQARYQSVLADLGKQALAGLDDMELMQSAVTSASQALDVEYCKVLERLPGGGDLLLRAGVGWKPGCVGSAVVGTDENSQAGYTLHSDEPVVVDDLRTESRFRGPALLTDHGVISGLSVTIATQRGSFGVIGAHTTRHRTFGRDDVLFLQAVANLIAAAVDRQRARTEIGRLNADLERRVIERTARLQEANDELEAFSYSVSHDLRAPLRAIDGFSRVLLCDHASELGSEGMACLGRVRASAQRMGRLMDDLLELSATQRGELRCAPVDLSALVHDIGAELQHSAPERSVELVVAEGVVADADANLIGIALGNLLGNAWKYTGKHATARIEFGVTERDGQAVYFLRDDGAGFDMEYADTLFGAFQRLHGVDQFQGTGIGLAIVHRIIRRHGGRIWADAEVERGATFYFTLRSRPLEEERDEAEPNAMWICGEPAACESPAAKFPAAGHQGWCHGRPSEDNGALSMAANPEETEAQ